MMNMFFPDFDDLIAPRSVKTCGGEDSSDGIEERSDDVDEEHGPDHEDLGKSHSGEQEKGLKRRDCCGKEKGNVL